MKYIITKEHIASMIEQGKANFPYASGGFVGGKSDSTTKIILGFYPVKEINLEHSNYSFIYTQEDYNNAHGLFFKKHYFYIWIILHITSDKKTTISKSL